MSSGRLHRLQNLFEEASEMPSGEQRAFLEHACADDTSLFRDVESLLQIHRAEGPGLDRAFGFLGTLTAGEMVGPYRVVREIGRGGMGIVYLAEDTRLGRQVALKALAPGLRASSKQQARFRREAAVAASLSHPGIAITYALEEWNSGVYIVGEYLLGETLAEEFEHGTLSPEATLDIGVQISSALAAAHDQGVVHRDLKPHNVIRASRGRLKILDFGLAIVFDTAASQTRFTAAGALLGTPAYMSPEQLRGEPVDFRCDLFALGVILAEAATGRNPFVGNTLAVTMVAILEDDPAGLEPLAEASPGLQEAVVRCLQKDPRQRWQSARKLNAELRRLQHRPREWRNARAAPPPERRVTVGWWALHQISVIAFCAVLTVLLWQVNSWEPGLTTRIAFIAGMSAASVIATLRVHLLFTLRYNRQVMLRELSRVQPWLRGADWSFSAVLAAAALATLWDRRLVAAILAAAAVGYAVVFLFVEPATREAVFREKENKA